MENQKKTILVVEDEQPLAEAIKKKLEINNFNVVTARSTEQAITYLNDVKGIVAIWLDHYLLGQESGLDFVAQLKKESGEWRQVPIFVVSNTASGEKVQSYLRFGISKYYTKADYRLDDIIGDINEFLEKEDRE